MQLLSTRIGYLRTQQPVSVARPPATGTAGSSAHSPAHPPAQAQTRVRRRRLTTLAAMLLAPVTLLTIATPVAVSAAPASPSAPAVDRFTRSSSPEVAAAARSSLEALRAFEQHRLAVAYSEYLDRLDRTATLAANELGLDPAEMITAWRETARPKQIALLAALTQLGVPYRSMASSEGEGFDCSGLVHYAWRTAGVDLPRSSRNQIAVGRAVSAEEAMAGDSVYYPGHIMMYLGVDTAIVHSPNTGNLVEIRFVAQRRASSVRYGDPLATS